MRRLVVAVIATSTMVATSTASARHERKTYRTYATSYCLRGTMADGSHTRVRSVASNFLPLGTKIRLVGRSFYGARRFVVRDTGSALSDGHLDLWHPSCASAIRWGRRPISFKIGWRR